MRITRPVYLALVVVGAALLASQLLLLPGCSSGVATSSTAVSSTSGTAAAGAALDPVKLKVLAALADPNLKVADIVASKEAPKTPEADLVLEWPSGSADVNTAQGCVYRLSFDRTPPESGAPQPGMDELQARSLEAAQALGWEDSLPRDIWSSGGDSVYWVFTPPYTYTWTWPEYDTSSDTMKEGSFQVVTDSLGRLRSFSLGGASTR
jgi:hypothetical protein